MEEAISNNECYNKINYGRPVDFKYSGNKQMKNTSPLKIRESQQLKRGVKNDCIQSKNTHQSI